MSLDLARARLNMVENQVRTNDVTDLHVQDAMREVARDRFARPGRADFAYAEAPVEYADGGWWLAEPRDVSKLLQALRPRPGERGLAIAAPYAAAVMAKIGLAVTARETVAAAAQVGEALAAAGAKVVCGELATLDEAGPFDVIVCEGGVEVAPPTWGEALAIGGRMGVIERHGPVGKARIYLRTAAGVLARREVFDATPHMLPGFTPTPVFQF